MTAKELREMDDTKLTEKLAESRDELFKLRFQHSTAQLENIRTIGVVKQTIARIMTVQRERQGA